MGIEISHLDFSYGYGYNGETGKKKNIRETEETAQTGKRQIFRDFSYSLAEGEVLCIMGASGCGKTTLLKLLSGRIKPDGGSIHGLEKRHISMVFQENRLCEDFSAETNVKLGCGRGYFGGCKEADIRKHLTEVGLGGALDKKVSELSGGMKRRVAIVRALLSKSDILLMDEPLKGLDEATKQEVIAYIRRYRENRTMIVVTHDKEEAAAFSGRLLVLS